MRVLVAYATYYGATEGIAECIADTLRREDIETTLANVEHLDAWIPRSMRSSSAAPFTPATG